MAANDTKEVKPKGTLGEDDSGGGNPGGGGGNKDDKSPPWFKEWVRENAKKLRGGPDSGVHATPGLRNLLKTLAEQGATKKQLQAFVDATPTELSALEGPNGGWSPLKQLLADNPDAMKNVVKYLNKNHPAEDGVTNTQNSALQAIPGFRDYYLAQLGHAIAPPGSPYAGTVVDAATGLPLGQDNISTNLVNNVYNADYFKNLTPEALQRYEDLYTSGQMRGNILAAYRGFIGQSNAVATPGQEGYVSTEERFANAGLPNPGSQEFMGLTNDVAGNPLGQAFYNATSSAFFNPGTQYSVPKPQQEEQTGTPTTGYSGLGGFDVETMNQFGLGDALSGLLQARQNKALVEQGGAYFDTADLAAESEA